jgi:hypothetical protein
LVDADLVPPSVIAALLDTHKKIPVLTVAVRSWRKRSVNRKSVEGSA